MRKQNKRFNVISTLLNYGYVRYCGNFAMCIYHFNGKELLKDGKPYNNFDILELIEHICLYPERYKAEEHPACVNLEGVEYLKK